ncbi:ATP-binding protein, partial [Streptomyces sp. NPDC002643]
LIVSELSANAILHTASGLESGRFHLALAVSPQFIALSVTDGGGTATVPKVEHQDQEAEHGRGLGMVTALAHRVVVHGSKGGYTVTAELFTGTRPGDHLC